MARFNDIERAEELLAAKRKLEDWRKLDRAAKQAAYAASRLGLRTNFGKQTGYIRPFGGADNFWYETKVLSGGAPPPKKGEENEPTLINIISAALIAASDKPVITTAPTGANIVIKKARKIQFAKCKVILPGTAPERDRTSRFTGRVYTQKEMKSVSCSFGATTANQTEQEAQQAIRALILAANPNAIVSFKPQGFVG